MFTMSSKQAETFSRETFLCSNCNRDFEAQIITWVDASKTPQVKQALLNWEFNILQCTHCGSRYFSSTPFFYEDFEEGLLIAVFPVIPEDRGEIEQSVRNKYSYYPVLDFFYDMTQLWMLVYFQENYKANKNLRFLSRLGRGEERIRKILRFLKEEPLMIVIREKLKGSFFGDATNDDLAETLGQAVYRLEEMLPWPMDGRCICGANLAEDFSCCGRPVDLTEHEHLLSRHYVIYCPVCKEPLSGTSCDQCSKVYTWKLGTVLSYKQEGNAADKDHPPQDQGTRLSPG